MTREAEQMTMTDDVTVEPDNLPALPEPQAVDVTAPLGLPSQGEWGAMMQMADVLSRSGLVPSALRRKPDDIILVLLAGRDLRLQPTVALNKIHVIEGKPTCSAELMTALVNRQPGMRLWPDPGNGATKATAHGVRDGQAVSFSFDEADARRAGLVGKGTWAKYPQFMLWARAASGLCRMAFADVLAGVTYTPEELGAEVNPETGEVIDATARETPPAAPQAPSPDEPFTPKAVAQIRAACADAGFTEDDITDMVEMGTEGRTSILEEVTYGERPALAKAKAQIVERKASIADDGLPANPEFDVDGDGQGEPREVPEWLLYFARLADQVREKVDPSVTAKVSQAKRTKLILSLKDLEVLSSEDQRLALATMLGKQVRSRSDLTASEAQVVLDVLAEEGAG